MIHLVIVEVDTLRAEAVRRVRSRGLILMARFFRRCSWETRNHKTFFFTYEWQLEIIVAEISTTVKNLVLLFCMHASIFYILGLHLDNISLGFGFERHVNIFYECSNMELLKYVVSVIHRNTAVYLREWSTTLAERLWQIVSAFWSSFNKCR